MEAEATLDSNKNMHTEKCQPASQLSFDASTIIVCCEIECIQDTSEGECSNSPSFEVFSALFLILSSPLLGDENPFAPFFSSWKHIVWRGVPQRAEQAQSDYEFPLFHCSKKTQRTTLVPPPCFPFSLFHSFCSFSIPEPA